jgi:diaminohydroxyphosphoribosylaminopyrimidine deaminase / 5-amino-6-(5-phosphoribosylamino)uracil reductase
MSDAAATDSAWQLVLGAAAMAEALEEQDEPVSFRAAAEGHLQRVPPEATDVALTWTPGTQWALALPPTDARSALLDLYLPICGATPSRPITIGHLGQSLDGFIATRTGDSQFVTGYENMVHMHRLRALCDAVVVGAGTVAADDPQLTTRLVDGPNALRVILDPQRRLAPTARVFTDAGAPTLYACASAEVRSGETHVGTATMLALEAPDGEPRLSELLAALRARGCARVFVEGGGVTVSTLLDCSLLDRLQIAVAPVLIGDGRPGIRMPPPTHLRDCRRPAYRVFRMGGDLLYDCDLRVAAPADANTIGPPLVRVI